MMDEPINLEGDCFDTLAGYLLSDIGLDRELETHVRLNAESGLAKILRCLISERHAIGLLDARSWPQPPQEEE